MTSAENPASASAETCLEALEQSRRETRAAFENRALMYAYLYDELAAEIGDEQATDLMKRAIRRRGVEIGAKYRPAVSRGDLAEVARIFVEGSPAEGSLFEPGVEEPPDEGRLVLKMTACPLVDAWRAAGYDDAYIDHLCEIAAEVDHGTFEGAGLGLAFLERQPAPGGCRCLLELTLPAGGAVAEALSEQA
jgi:predicted ArsR family transcriptional regulator